MQKIKWVGREARCFIRDESGATSIEYTLLAAIMGVGIITSIQELRTALNAAITIVYNAVANA